MAMKGCVFVTMKDNIYGFMLAGFQQEVADRETLLMVVEKIMKSSGAGLIFIDERLLTEKIRGRLQFLEKTWGGALISLPVPFGKVEPGKDDYGNRFISRVLGYHMKLD